MGISVKKIFFLFSILFHAGFASALGYHDIKTYDVGDLDFNCEMVSGSVTGK